MGLETGSPGTRSWWRLPLAVIVAPLVVALALTLTVLVLASLTEGALWPVIERTVRAAIVFTTALLAFSLTFGTLGVLLLLALRQYGFAAWAWIGALLGVVAAMLHGLIQAGVVVGFEMSIGGLLGALTLLLIRFLGGVAEAQRPS